MKEQNLTLATKKLLGLSNWNKINWPTLMKMETLQWLTLTQKTWLRELLLHLVKSKCNQKL
jgi:hypothetical protein